MKRAAALLLAALVSGCDAGTSLPPPIERGTPSPSLPGSPTPIPTPPPGLNLVVVGDSIPLADPCPTCAHFVDQYANALQERSGRTVAVTNRARGDSAGLPQILDQVTSDTSLRDQLKQADIVVLSVGYNNVLPDYGNPPPGGLPPGCDAVAPGIGDVDIAHIVAFTPKCNAATAARWATDYGQIFTTIVGLRADKPTAFIALNVYDGNLDNPDIRAAVDAKTFAATENVIVDAYNTWNTMLCRDATAHGFSCVDIYHAMNGPDGTRPLGDLSIDGAHPSQKGSDLIAALLAKADVSKVIQ